MPQNGFRQEQTIRQVKSCRSAVPIRTRYTDVKLFYWQSTHGNFGDDMNRFMWRNFMPDFFDDDEEELFIGIGTILSADIPPARKRIVMGSGSGYGRLPGDLHNGGWQFYAVRGPLTARAIGGRPDLAVTDPAVLLPLIPELRSVTRHGVAFVPHWTTAAEGIWQRACRAADVTFIDPRDPADEVVRRIAAAKLVIAESMHAAIVADAFRVPWIPIVSARDTPLKWHDWALSMGLHYQPYAVGHLSLVPMLKGLTGLRYELPPIDADDYDTKVEAILQRFLRRSVSAMSRAKATATMKAQLVRQIRTVLDKGALRALAQHGAEILGDLSKRPGTLSVDRMLYDKQNTLLERMERLRHEHATLAS